MTAVSSRFEVVTEEEILQMFTFLECVMTEFVDTSTNSSFNLGEYWRLKYSFSASHDGD